MQDPHSRNRRKGRWSGRGQYYLLTTCVAGRRKIFTCKQHARLILDAIRWLDSTGRFLIDAAVVMPDHLHMAGQLGTRTLGQCLHALKSFTAHKLVLAGVDAPVWQDGYHDHGLRDEREYEAMVAYLLENPVRAGLAERVEDYPYLILPSWW